MEIKVYDESGKVIKIIPMYQVGGPVLPQYTPTETSMYRPQQSANTSLDVSQRNLEFRTQREMQSRELTFREGEQLLRTYQNALDNEYKRQTQERLNKSMDLQNEKFKQSVLESNNELMNNIISSDDEMFLPRDRAQIDKLMEESGFSDKSLLDINPSDTEGLYKFNLNKRAFLASQKNALDNKRKWDESANVLKNFGDIEKRAKAALDGGYLDEDSYFNIVKSFNNVQQKRQDWGNGKIEFDIASDPDYQLINQYSPVIDEAEMKQVFDMEKQTAALTMDINKHKAEAAKQQLEVDKEEFEFNKKMRPLEMRKKIAETITGFVPSVNTMSSINSALPAEKQINFTDPDKLFQSLDSLTKEDWDAISNNLEQQKQSSSGKLDIEDQILQAYLKGDMDTVNNLLDLQRKMTESKDKNASITYNTDNTGTYNQDKDGSRDYGGFRLDKDGNIDSIVFAGQTRNINTTGESKGKVQGIPDAELTTMVDSDGKLKGYLKVKGNNLDNVKWLQTIYPEWKPFININGITNYELDDFPESGFQPKGTVFKEGYLYLPAEDVNPQATTPASGASSSIGTGGSYFGGGGKTQVAPNASSVL